MYRKITEEMLSFIQKNPTAFHTVSSIKAVLDGQGYGGWRLLLLEPDNDGAQLTVTEEETA